MLIIWLLFQTGLRQERPAHLHPESIYQAMRERGRAIPATPTVPIVERKTSPSNPPPRIVDGRVSYDFDLQLIFYRRRQRFRLLICMRHLTSGQGDIGRYGDETSAKYYK